MRTWQQIRDKLLVYRQPWYSEVYWTCYHWLRDNVITPLRPRFVWQRLTMGFDERDCWSLDYTIAKFALPRLRMLKNIQHGWPGEPDFPTPEDWNRALDDMIYAMSVISCDDWPPLPDDYDAERVQRGCELFGKYFTALWD